MSNDMLIITDGTARATTDKTTVKQYLERMGIKYSHRNGGTEPPTIDDWYFFEGVFHNTFGDHAFDTVGIEIVQLEEGIFWVNGDNGGYDPHQLRGRFWGPIPKPKVNE